MDNINEALMYMAIGMTILLVLIMMPEQTHTGTSLFAQMFGLGG